MKFKKHDVKHETFIQRTCNPIEDYRDDITVELHTDFDDDEPKVTLVLTREDLEDLLEEMDENIPE